ncbi:MAG: dipeptidase [Planctomycetota bacterium]
MRKLPFSGVIGSETNDSDAPCDGSTDTLIWLTSPWEGATSRARWRIVPPPASIFRACEPQTSTRCSRRSSPNPTAPDGVRAGLEQLAVYEGLEQAGEVMIVRSAGDLDADGSLPRLVLLMEGADPIRDAEHVAWWASRGLWLVGLTWATGTRYAGGNARPGPITAAGRDVVRAIDQAGLVHDASHLATTALDDLLDLATGPIVATHSNCRSITGDDERHLTDDHIRAIGARGGVVGLNLYRRFIAGSGPVTAAHAIEHVVRVAELMNRRDGVALGSDMDGGFGPEGLPDDVRHPSAFGALAAGLRTAGWNDEEIEGFAWRNWTGFLRTVIH